MKQSKRPAESKFGSIFQTGSSPTDSKGIVLSYPDRALHGVGSMSHSFYSAWWRQKPKRRARCKQCAQCRVVKKVDKDLYKMHCILIKVASAKRAKKGAKRQM